MKKKTSKKGKENEKETRSPFPITRETISLENPNESASDPIEV